MIKISDHFEIENSMPEDIRPGAWKEKDGIRFTVVLKEGEKASLLLYEKGQADPVMEEAFPQKPVIGQFYTMKIFGLPWRQYDYNLQIEDEIVPDPAAALISGGRCRLSFQKFDWKNDMHPDISWEDAVLYHVHVRNFTKHPKSGVRNRGTFRGLQEKIPYLKQLGVNLVKLMPVYDFEEALRKEEFKQKPETAKNQMREISPDHIPTVKTTEEAQQTAAEQRRNCWGYAPANYYAPKASYAASDNPARELKEMVRAFHENGMEILLEMFFTDEMPVRDILNVLTWWVREYHVDGFLFVGRDDFVKFLLEDPVLCGRKLMGAGYPGKVLQDDEKKRNFAEYNDGFKMDMRRLLKGDEGMLESFAFHTRRNPGGFGVVNYITSHDGFTLQDLVSYDQKHNEENGEGNEDGAVWNFSWNCGVEGPSKKKTVCSLRRRMVKNAFLMMLFSQGTPMILSGDEFGNSQNGNNNPYCLDSETAWVDWQAKARNKNLLEFVKKAIEFRKEHRVLHQNKELRLTDYRSVGIPDLSYHSKRAWYGGFEYESRQIGLMYNGDYCKEEEFLYVAYNLHPLKQELALPKLKSDRRWTLAVDTSQEQSFLEDGGQELPAQQRSCVVPARSIQVFIGKKAE